MTVGLKIGRNGRRYWLANQARRGKAAYYRPKSIELPMHADKAELERLCKKYTVDLDAWIEQPGPQVRTVYDGTMRSACRIYQEHEDSSFNLVKYNTQATYLTSLRLIERTVGHLKIPDVTVPQVRGWHRKWLEPSRPGGREHVKRAEDAIAMVRAVLRFMASLRTHDGCKQLSDELAHVRFAGSRPREQYMTIDYVRSFLDAAGAMWARGEIPLVVARSVMIGVAAPFETLLRQRDIVGEWARKGARRKLPPDITVIEAGRDVWIGYFVWENFKNWRWVMRTSKSSYRESGDFRLDKLSLLYPLLGSVPYCDRVGAVVKGEDGLPIRYRTYARWFRVIARRAGIPDDVWLMDARAGGATEADMAGASIGDIQGAMRHKNPTMTARYIRSGPGRKITAVADARAKKRAEDADG